MKLSDIFIFSLKNLLHRKKRSYLTIIGIFIGIMAVVSLLSLGQGLQSAVSGIFEKMGSDVVTIMPGKTSEFGFIGATLSNEKIRENEIKSIERMACVDKVLKMKLKVDEVGFHKKTFYSFVVGVNVDGLGMLIGEGKYDIIKGRNMEKGDKYSALIGYDLYKGSNSPGIDVYDKIKIGGEDIRVIGIVEKIGDRIDDKAVYLPIDVFNRIYGEDDYYDTVYVKVKNNCDPEEVADEIKRKLRKMRREKEGEESFTVMSAKEMLKMVQEILSIIQGFIIGVAAISILVGGIGIMNTMYTAVLERTKDIGILKALGATKRDILLLFLFESGLLGLLGGLIGIILGLSIAFSAQYFIESYYGVTLLKASVSLELILGSLLFSFVVGAISGLIPAKNASELQPVEALREE